MKRVYNNNNFDGYQRNTKRRSSARWNNYAGAANQLVKDVAMLKRAINSETKHHDLDISATPTQAGFIGTLFAPSQGVGASQRVGDQVKVTGLHLDAEAFADPGGVAGVVRFIIFIQKEYDSTLTGAQLLEFRSGLAPLNPFCPINWENRGDIKIIADKLVDLDAQGGLSVMFKTKRKLSEICRFEPGSTVPTKSAIRYCLMTDVTANVPAFRGVMRITYVDN